MHNPYIRKMQQTSCYEGVEFDTQVFDRNGPFNIYIPKRHVRSERP